MDQVIATARTLGKALQADERFSRFMAAQEVNEADTGLRNMVSEFHKIKTELNNEMSKPDKDQEEIKALDAKLKDMYRDIFANRNMIELTEARNDLEALVNFINQIITGSTNGIDPDTIEYSESCGGSCSSCSGCH